MRARRVSHIRSARVIRAVRAFDARYQLAPGEGIDAIHNTAQYGYAVTRLDAGEISGTGLAFTLGGGNEAICPLIERLAGVLVGREIEELMADFGRVFRELADEPQYRWLGPHKGAVHLALASITNACFDLWAKSRGIPLWRLLLDLTPAQLVATLDLSYVDDVVAPSDAVRILEQHWADRSDRSDIIERGYAGYDTSAGWFAYSDTTVVSRAREALEAGFLAVKLKVGGRDEERDVRRAFALRDALGPDVSIMLDANQQWSLEQALRVGEQVREVRPFWIEEPTHPDDIEAHRVLARSLAPVAIAAGEAVPNRVVFKNLLQANALGIVQVDSTRVGGISEFITVSLLARHYNKPVVPHVGDMGQIHQHLVLFNRIALGCDELFLEYIPHLRDRFVEPAIVSNGRYLTPAKPGASTDLRPPIGRVSG
jgi:L-fuconate dehydratase